jgi:hypothetical protein
VAIDAPLLAFGTGAAIELRRLDGEARATIRLAKGGRAGFAMLSDGRAHLLGPPKAASALLVRREGGRCAPVESEDFDPRPLVTSEETLSSTT